MLLFIVKLGMYTPIEYYNLTSIKFIKIIILFKLNFIFISVSKIDLTPFSDVSEVSLIYLSTIVFKTLSEEIYFHQSKLKKYIYVYTLPPTHIYI